jgi:tetratricopeptide (TPR) repeat protein
MRRLVVVALLAIPAGAWGRGSVSFSFRGGSGLRVGRGGRFGRSGVYFHYGRHTSHSHLSIAYRSGGVYTRGGYGTRGYGSRSVWYGGYRGYGLYRSGGVSVYRGGYRGSPYFYHHGYPSGVYYGVGPYTYGDAVIFTGSPELRVFGYRARAGAEVAPAPAVDYSQLSLDQAVDLGDERFARGDFAGAVAAYRAAAAKGADDPMAAFALGHGLFATGAYAEAAAELRRGIRLFPGVVRVQMDRRDFYGDPAAFEAQLHALARHVAAAPDGTAARFLLAYNYFFSQQAAKAKEHFAALGAGDAEARLFLEAIAEER